MSSTTAGLCSDFVKDLQDVYAHLDTDAIPSVFLSHLASVYSNILFSQRAESATISQLAMIFDSWRSNVQEQARLLLMELSPDDDPLTCRISLFRTMDYGRLETAHTRTLAWLLDPSKEHEFGHAILRALLSRVTEFPLPKEIQVRTVASEHPISTAEEDGRLDVFVVGEWIRNGEAQQWALVVEAKIGASEGRQQLAKYDTWLKANYRGFEVIRVFLTPHRDLYSETATEEWRPLSFSEFVGVLRPVYFEMRGRPGFHFLRFYLAGVLQDICGFRWQPSSGIDDPYLVVEYLRPRSA